MNTILSEVKIYLLKLNPITQILLLFSCLLLSSCNTSNSNQTTETNATTTPDGFYKGVLHFKLTNDAISEKIYYKQLDVFIDGENIRQEVKAISLNQIDKTFGMVYKAKENFVSYYMKSESQNIYTMVRKKDFMNWVATMNVPFDTNGITQLTGKVPFSTVFKPLPDDNKYTINQLGAVPYLDIKDAQQMNIVFDKDKKCEVIYSPSIKVPASILQMSEHHQPNELHTIALRVSYNKPKAAATTSGIKNILNKIVETATEMTSFTIECIGRNNLVNGDLDIPKECIFMSADKFNLIVTPPAPEYESSGSSHHHDWD